LSRRVPEKKRGMKTLSKRFKKGEQLPGAVRKDAKSFFNPGHSSPREKSWNASGYKAQKDEEKLIVLQPK